jgi:hypothetical protein
MGTLVPSFMRCFLEFSMAETDDVTKRRTTLLTIPAPYEVKFRPVSSLEGKERADND